VIFPPKGADRTRKQLTAHAGAWSKASEKAVRKHIQDDPTFWLPYCLLATWCLERGDRQEAETLFWQAVRTAPDQTECYLALAAVLEQNDNVPACTIIMSLGMRRGLFDNEHKQEISQSLLRGLTPELRQEMMEQLSGDEELVALTVGRIFSQKKPNEPELLSAQFATLRAVNEILDPLLGPVPQATLDDLTNNPEESVPLLCAVIRSWMAGRLGDSGNWSARAAFALLGEIGGPALLEDLTEFLQSEDERILDAVTLAAVRILERFPPPPGSQLDPKELREEFDGKLEDFLDYDGPDTDEEYAEDDDELPLAAINLGRNDPCWCGSGRKYKKCHLNEDETRRRTPKSQSADSHIARLLMDFMNDEFGKEDLTEAMGLFFGHVIDEFESEATQMCFMDWAINDFQSRKFGRTVVEEYRVRHGSSLPQSDQLLLKEWSCSRYGILEVLRVDRGTGVEVKDLLFDDVFFVYDVTSSLVLKPGITLLTRIRQENGRTIFTASGLTVPPAVRDPFLDWVIDDRAAQALDWHQYLKANSHRLLLKAKTMADDWRKNIKFVSFEGDELCFSKRHYTVLDPAALDEALRGSPAIGDPVKTGKKTTYPWLEGTGDGPKRSLGTIEVENKKAFLDCSTKQRLRRGEEFLEEIAGKLLTIGKAEFVDPKTAMKMADDN